MIVYNILQSDGLKYSDYKDGLLSSISILSKALNKNECNVYKPLNTIYDFNKVSDYTIFNSEGLQKVFNNDKDAVGASYTEYSFITFVYFLSNLYKDNKEKTIIPLSNNLKLLNSQLIKANAFKKDKTGKPIIPYLDRNIVINITTTPNKNNKNKIGSTQTTTPLNNYIKQINTEKIYVPMPIFLDNRSQNKYNYFSNNVIYKDKLPNFFDSNTNSFDSNYINSYKKC